MCRDGGRNVVDEAAADVGREGWMTKRHDFGWRTKRRRLAKSIQSGQIHEGGSSDSIRNNCRADPRSLNYRGAKRGITAASAVGFVPEPGRRERNFWMRRQAVKNRHQNGSAHRDKNPGNEWSEIPAETHYFSSCRKRAVCKDRTCDPST